jgi:NAD-specific glutamate dehydrogenase
VEMGEYLIYSLKEESRIEFFTISNDLIELSGTPEKMMEVKERLGEALNGMIRFEVKMRDGISLIGTIVHTAITDYCTQSGLDISCLFIKHKYYIIAYKMIKKSMINLIVAKFIQKLV